MGLYDTLWKDNESVQVKCLGRIMNNYYIGDRLPQPRIDYSRDLMDISTYTIFLPDYEKYRLVIVEDNILVDITNDFSKIKEPIISKIGYPVIIGEM